jgi:hypothetical protein
MWRHNNHTQSPTLKQTEDDVDLHGPYIGLERSEGVKTTRTETVAGDGDAAPR